MYRRVEERAERGAKAARPEGEEKKRPDEAGDLTPEVIKNYLLLLARLIRLWLCPDLTLSAFLDSRFFPGHRAGIRELDSFKETDQSSVRSTRHQEEKERTDFLLLRSSWVVPDMAN